MSLNPNTKKKSLNDIFSLTVSLINPKFGERYWGGMMESQNCYNSLILKSKMAAIVAILKFLIDISQTLIWIELKSDWRHQSDIEILNC